MTWGLVHLSNEVTREQLGNATAEAFGLDASDVFVSFGGDGDIRQARQANVTVAVMGGPDHDPAYPVTFVLLSFTDYPIPDDLTPIAAIVDRIGGHALATPEAQGIYEHYYYLTPGRPPIEVELDDDAEYLEVTPESLARIEAQAA